MENEIDRIYQKLERQDERLEKQERRARDFEDAQRRQNAHRPFDWFRAGMAALTLFSAGGAGYVAGDYSDGGLYDRAYVAQFQPGEQRAETLQTTQTYDPVNVADISAAVTCPEQIRVDLGPSGPLDMFLIKEESYRAGLTLVNYGVFALDVEPPYTETAAYHYECRIDLYADSLSVIGFPVPIERLNERRAQLQPR